MTAASNNFFLYIGCLLLALISFSNEITAQSKPTYSVDKPVYRVVAVKNDTARVESISNTAELLKPSTLYLPNAFTPDRDGSNDTFGAVGINVEKYELKIFNRWGELLFESNDINHKWDGTHKGSLVQDGVYVYTFYAKELTTGKNISKTGTVTLLL
jgi:gliding motility-associated-like protein